MIDLENIRNELVTEEKKLSLIINKLKTGNLKGIEKDFRKLKLERMGLFDYHLSDLIVEHSKDDLSTQDLFRSLRLAHTKHKEIVLTLSYNKFLDKISDYLVGKGLTKRLAQSVIRDELLEQVENKHEVNVEKHSDKNKISVFSKLMFCYECTTYNLPLNGNCKTCGE